MHGLPLCLRHELGGTMQPAISDWKHFTQAQATSNYDYSNMTNYTQALIEKWPATGTATLLGYVRDGYPIYSPYDDDAAMTGT